MRSEERNSEDEKETVEQKIMMVSIKELEINRGGRKKHCQKTGSGKIMWNMGWMKKIRRMTNNVKKNRKRRMNLRRRNLEKKQRQMKRRQEQEW